MIKNEKEKWDENGGKEGERGETLQREGMQYNRKWRVRKGEEIQRPRKNQERIKRKEQRAAKGESRRGRKGRKVNRREEKGEGMEGREG